MKRFAKWALTSTLSLAALYLLLLTVPYPLFAYQARYENIAVYSDRPIPSPIAEVLRDAESRLQQSPLNDPAMRHPLFLCNDQWRFTLFANRQYRVGGLTYAVLNDNIFLRESDIAHNRLISYSGKEIERDRPLSYFVAHEITHTLEAHFPGLAQWNLPVWKREGYADVVGRGADFNFKEQLAAFQHGDRRMDPAASGLYLRYALECWYLLHRRGVTPQALLTEPFDEAAIDRELRKLR